MPQNRFGWRGLLFEELWTPSLVLSIWDVTQLVLTPTCVCSVDDNKLYSLVFRWGVTQVVLAPSCACTVDDNKVYSLVFRWGVTQVLLTPSCACTVDGKDILIWSYQGQLRAR